MTVQHISAGMPTPLRADGGRFFLPGANDFAGGLRLGEIIKGKVLRQYDGNRYLVSFDGRERVVDSNLPLSTGELIHGRVAAIGERVELQRVYPSNAAVAPVPAQGESLTRSELSVRQALPDALLARYNVRLSDEDAAALTNAVRNAHDADAMALVGALVNKLGLRQAPELLWSVYNSLTRRLQADATSPQTDIVSTVRDASWQPATISPAALRQLTDAIDRTITPAADKDDAPDGQPPSGAGTLGELAPLSLPAPKPISDEDGGRSPTQEQLAYWLLNAQVGGTVAHRIGTLPLLLGDRLIEVEMSFFEQHADAEQKLEAKHRKIVFALQLEHLGRVEVTARLAGEHASVSVTTEAQDKTAEVARYVEQLKSLLTRLGWTVDQVSYATHQADGYNGVVRSVVEHVVSHDSLDRRI